MVLFNVSLLTSDRNSSIKHNRKVPRAYRIQYESDPVSRMPFSRPVKDSKMVTELDWYQGKDQQRKKYSGDRVGKSLTQRKGNCKRSDKLRKVIKKTKIESTVEL